MQSNKNRLISLLVEIADMIAVLWRVATVQLASVKWGGLAVAWLMLLTLLSLIFGYGHVRHYIWPVVFASIIIKLIADERQRDGKLDALDFSKSLRQWFSSHHDASYEGTLARVLEDIFEACGYVWNRLSERLALVSWKRMALYWLLFSLVCFATFGDTVGEALGPAIVVSIIIKALASGKFEAEERARDANSRAEVEALERRLLEAQMAALQAQIEPHFLFNTLALISQMIETNPSEAAKIHQYLIRYLRAAMPQMRDAGSATLGRQIEMSRAYLSIMMARMGERLTVSIDVPESLNNANFPSMMVQTLVENAIKHGLEPKIEGGHIQVSARVSGDMLQVDVEDNGTGFDLRAPDGVGLSNIKERLRILYPERGQFLIDIPSGGGTRASILIPLAVPENEAPAQSP